jgi:hypothetical protein
MTDEENAGSERPHALSKIKTAATGSITALAGCKRKGPVHLMGFSGRHPRSMMM